MQKFLGGNGGVQTVSSGKPSIPGASRQPMVERRISDPSSAAPKGERYPIPSFFDYRIKPRDYERI